MTIPARRFPRRSDAALHVLVGTRAGRTCASLTLAPGTAEASRRSVAAGLPCATRWHHENVPAKALAERVGHSDATLTLNLYSHVLDPGELPQESLEALLDAAPVWPR